MEGKLGPTAVSMDFPQNFDVLIDFLNIGPGLLETMFKYDFEWLEALIDSPLPPPKGVELPLAHRGVLLYDEMQIYTTQDVQVWLEHGLRALGTSHPDTAQALVDHLIQANGGYPLPGSVKSLNQLMNHTLQDEREALAWTWADSWSSVRLMQNMLTRARETAQRLTYLAERPMWWRHASAAGDAKTHLFIMREVIQSCRRFVMTCLTDHFGSEWRVKALDPKELSEIGALYYRDQLRAPVDFMAYAELGLLKDLVDRHWHHVFQPFFRSFPPGHQLRGKEKKKLMSELQGAIPLRNALMHQKWSLEPPEVAQLNQLHEEMCACLEHLQSKRSD